MINKEQLLEKWRALTPNRRMMIAGGSAAFILVLGTLNFGSPAPAEEKNTTGKGLSNFSVPMDKDVSVEQLAAKLESLRQGQEEEKFARQRLETAISEFNKQKQQPDPLTADVTREVRDMRVELDTIKAQKSLPSSALQTPPSPDDQLPPPDDSDPTSGSSSQSHEARSEHPPIRIIGGANKQEEKTAEGDKQPPIYLPAGSNFEGIMLNGMDAPTSGVTKSNPVPALIRLDTDAILPSRYRYDIRECFTIVTGFGVLSTERAQLQTVSISCIKNDGSVIESKLEGYVVGEDGKVGIRGRLVTKQGQLLAKTFAAGILSGIGQALAPVAVPQLNVNPGASTQVQTPSLNSVATTATANGLTETAKSLSQFYLEMAKEMFPVIEIDAMRRVTIILVRGVELNVSGEK
ncbi:MAG: TraB/VirB10 family protein [Sideroxydans sp.]|nr:TraB/VirB10 family protein [Sideroxydans sp.]MDD5056625.1 TraB/VirB10 family protein [Sideroxydans sp.]